MYIKMNYAIEHITRILKEARERKGLSQRALSKQAGVPQGQISKIENGGVDLRLSSLIGLSRALDLELTLVPRKAMPAVKSIVRSSEPHSSGISRDMRAAMQEVKRFQDAIASLSQVQKATTEVSQLQRYLHDFAHFILTATDLESIREANKAIQVFKNNEENMGPLRQALAQLRDLRNNLAHSFGATLELEPIKPAYSLDEDDNG